MNAGYVISLVAALILLGVLATGWRRRGRGSDAGSRPERTVDRSTPLSARRAALIAVPVALALGFAFAARATPLFALGVFFMLWRGIGAKQLALAGGAVLGLALPLLYVVAPPENRGGFNPEYSIDRIAAHWVAVAGVTLMILALSRAMGRPGRARSAPPSAAGPPRSGP